ncbi:MAG: hypothetical protein P4L33_05510 [Capsulimonadaceae bacterium]|nr:hypothetical protein [Capsulimonadaceae bacterium]
MPNDDQSADLTVEIGSADVKPKDRRSLDKPIALVREGAAREVASKLILIFGWAIAGAFLVIFCLIALAVRFPETVANKLAAEIDEILRVLQVVGTMFSPLLAFILGYYFGSPYHTDNHLGVSDNKP